MENSTFVAADSWGADVAAALPDLPGMTLVNVSMIAVDFTESPSIDPGDIPASPNFSGTASGTPEVLYDEVGPIWNFPDPVGGWDFVSSGTGFPVTIYGWRVDDDADTFRGCRKLPTPITITATGQHIILGKVQLRPKMAVIEPVPNGG